MRTLATLFAVTLVAAQGFAQTGQTAIRDHIEAMRHLRLGQDNLRAEKWDLAETEFRAAIRLEPLLEMAHYGLGQAHMATRRYPEAVDAYVACRDAFKVNVRRATTEDLEAERRLNDQIQVLEDERTLLNTGRIRPMLAGGPADLDRRIADLRSRRYHGAGAPLPVPTWISIALGSAYFRAGAMSDAEREYRAAIAVDPKLGEAHNNLAVVCMLMGRYAEATQEIKTAEKAGFRVQPQLKEDLKKASAGR